MRLRTPSGASAAQMPRAATEGGGGVGPRRGLVAGGCGGRAVCKDISALKPLSKLRALVNPGIGRTAQDDQLQLFATLLVVNLLHVKGTAEQRSERQELLIELQRAYDDATVQQVRRMPPAGRHMPTPCHPLPPCHASRALPCHASCASATRAIV